MKGRPITETEFVRMLRAVPRVVGPEKSRAWRFYLRGLWWSGLRLEESLGLSWDDLGTMRVELGDSKNQIEPGSLPVFRVPGGSEKGNRDRILPMAPEFAELLQKHVPPGERRGPVFRFPRERNYKAPTSKWMVSHVVSECGRLANIAVSGVNPRTGKQKFASAHDLRRAFGTRWARRVLPQVLQQLMRHERIETTLKYYVELNAQETAADLWRLYTNTKGKRVSP
jgi:integrase